MARGRTTEVQVSLTAQDRQTLEHWQRSPSMPVGRVRRGQIVLLLDAGASVSATARTVGISRRFVYKWVRRFLAQGVAGLMDQSRPGRRGAAQARGEGAL